MRPLVLALVCIVALGCASAFDRNVDKLKVGMTEAEVIAMFGNPDSRTESGSANHIFIYVNPGNPKDQVGIGFDKDGKAIRFDRKLIP